MENLTAIIVAEPNQYYAIDVNGYIQPHEEGAIVEVVDDQGRMYSRAIFNANSGIFNAYSSCMVSNFDGTVVFSVHLKGADWVLTEVIKPSLVVTRIQ